MVRSPFTCLTSMWSSLSYHRMASWKSCFFLVLHRSEKIASSQTCGLRLFYQSLNELAVDAGEVTEHAQAALVNFLLHAQGFVDVVVHNVIPVHGHHTAGLALGQEADSMITHVSGYHTVTGGGRAAALDVTQQGDRSAEHTSELYSRFDLV